jgi:hypothetical protein
VAIAPWPTLGERVKDEDFFLAIVYHEWFIIELAEGIFES